MSTSEPGSVTNQIRRAAAGDRDASAWLWERHRKLLYAMAADRCDTEGRSGAADTSDVVAEAGVRFADEEFFVGVKDRRHFQARLRQVISGKASDQRRRDSIRRAEEFSDEALDGARGEDVGFL